MKHCILHYVSRKNRLLFLILNKHTTLDCNTGGRLKNFFIDKNSGILTVVV